MSRVWPDPVVTDYIRTLLDDPDAETARATLGVILGDGDRGGQSAIGSRGQDGASLLSGQGTPSATDGVDRDSYIDLLTGNIFVKRSPMFGAPAAWKMMGNIRGPKGDPGKAGQPGAPGPAGAPGTGTGSGSSSTTDQAQDLRLVSLRG